MVNDTIQNIDISDFVELQDKMLYLTDDILVSGSFESMSTHLENAVRLNFFCMMTCVEGHIRVEVNNRPYDLSSGDSLITLPTMLVGNTMVSPQHKVRIMGFSTRFLHKVMRQGSDTPKALENFHNNPVVHAGDFGDLSIYRYYAELIYFKLQEHGNPLLKNDILDHLFSALFCEMITDMLRNCSFDMIRRDNQGIEGRYKRGNDIFKLFIKEVSMDNGMHRSLSYFADRLCYTSKYVSTVVKQVSGRGALDWINEMTMEQIKYQLKHTSKSMKEIADDFQFPNQSFFGKYVKQHLGISPAKYREMCE